MSMRLVAVFIGGLAMGNVPAHAVNAPVTVDPHAADPREDLFASKPKSPTPALAPPPVSTAVERPSAQPAAERGLSDNPLWAIPLRRLTASRERPLFAPTRHPPALAVAPPAPAPIAPPPRPVEAEKPQLSLLGTIVGGEKIGLFMDSASKTVVRLKAGENHKGWILRAVGPHQVELARGLDSAVLDLPPPDIKASGGPGLAAPALMPASASPANPALPVNSAKAAGVLPPGVPAGAPGVQPPTFTPPPAPVNPFGNRWQR